MIVMIPNLEHPYWSSVSSSVTATARNAQSKRLGHSDNSVLLRCMGFCDEGTAPAEKEEPHKGGLWTTNAIQFIEYVGLCPSLCPVAHCSLLDSRDRLFNSSPPRSFFFPSVPYPTCSAECYSWYPIENMKNDPSWYRIYDATLTPLSGLENCRWMPTFPCETFVDFFPFVFVLAVRAVNPPSGLKYEAALYCVVRLYVKTFRLKFVFMSAASFEEAEWWVNFGEVVTTRMS